MSKINIMDREARKYKNVRCPMCKKDKSMSINNVMENDFGNEVTESLCNNCDKNFELYEQEARYVQGSYDEEGWGNLT